jgi:hypothetical protein
MSEEKRRNRRGLERRLAWQQALHDPDRDPRNRLPQLPALRRFQHRRLAQGFQDLLADPRTRPAAEFFLSDLYGDRDFSRRDQDVARIAPLLSRLLPAALLGALVQAIELAVLSHAFDLKMARVLDRAGIEPDAIDTPAYGHAYRLAGCPRLRGRQIGLIVAVGSTLDRAVHTLGVSRMLRMSRMPARAAGVMDLQAFLERGFDAFRARDGADSFLGRIEAGEREVSRRLFAAHPEPFGPGGQVNSRSR